MNKKQQLRAIAGVAALSFRLAPGAVIFKLAGSVISALLPLTTTYYAARTTTALVDAYGGSARAKEQVLGYIILTAGLGLVMALWSSADNYVQAKMRYIVETRVSTGMYRHFLSLEFWRYDDKETADLYDRAQKFARFFAWVFDRIANVSSQLISAVGAVVALAFVSGRLALLISLALLPGVLVQFRLSRQNIRHWNRNVEVRRTISMLEWILASPRFIIELRLYGMVRFLLRRRTELRDADELHRIALERRLLPLTLLADVFTAVAEVGALVWIALKIAGRQQPVGQFVYVQQIVSRAISSASSLVSTLSGIDEDIANLYDYQAFMQLPAAKKHGRPASLPQHITVRGVSFRYPGKKQDVLHDVSLSIGRDQHVAIVGENGAGKTTLVKLLAGLYQPTGGCIMLDDQDLAATDVTSWHTHLAVLTQAFITYDFATVRDNVRFGNIDAPYDEARFAAALSAAEADGFVGKLPGGADSYVNNWMEDDSGEKGSELSGGQWQRLALARDFYREAPIVILDEPTSAVDALAEARIFKRLFSRRHRTIITISHRLSTVRKADIIYVLQNGRLAESGTYDELVKKRGSFYDLFESQIND